MSVSPAAPLGVTPRGDGASDVVVWAPRAVAVAVERDADRSRTDLEAGERGYHHGVADGLAAGDDYWLVLTDEDGDELRRADPASRHQPEGVAGPSRVVDPADHTTDLDGWQPPARHDLVLYELHVGTFTAEGTFDAAAELLPRVAEDGFTAVEVMPVAAFPGTRNWGYDGVFPWAVQDSYGGPAGFARFVDAAHAAGLAVHLDVVYNHLGPEGNVLGDFGPYFTDRYATPWGEALNVDGPDSDPVRRYVIDNAVRWVTEFGVDGLRLDAVHAIHDESAIHLLDELGRAVHAAADELGRRVDVIAESDVNDARLVRDRDRGGYGLDGVWDDDVHHAIHAALTGESDGYYVDYARGPGGGAADLARAWNDRFVFAGRYSPYRRRRHGGTADGVEHRRFVVCAQNHDQIGNRATGDRVMESLPPASRRLARALVLLSPFTPLVFMGEEHGATEPFPYFVSHTGEELVAAVREGRRREFAGFAWDDVPDPQDPATRDDAVVDWSRRDDGVHAELLALTRELLAVRRSSAVTGAVDAEVSANADGDVFVGTVRRGDDTVVLVANLGDTDTEVDLPITADRVLVDTADERWGGPGGHGLVGGGRLAVPAHAAVLVTAATAPDS